MVRASMPSSSTSWSAAVRIASRLSRSWPTRGRPPERLPALTIRRMVHNHTVYGKDSTMQPLAGKVALVTGGSRAAGRGIAVQLGAAGATVYVTGRTTRTTRSEMNRPETIEDTAELIDQAGGHGIAVPVDHLEPAQVQDLVARIEREQGALHILVNDIWGQFGEPEWDKTVWESDLEAGLRLLRLGVDTHAITSHYALPLLIKS